jgi:hypothetical protein
MHDVMKVVSARIIEVLNATTSNAQSSKLFSAMIEMVPTISSMPPDRVVHGLNRAVDEVVDSITAKRFDTVRISLPQTLAVALKMMGEVGEEGIKVSEFRLSL